MAVRDANLEECVEVAQRERILLTRRGKPVAVVLGVQGLDREQIELGLSDEFWTLIRERRGQRTMTRAELEKRLSDC
jgi:prevent-host-death family protein